MYAAQYLARQACRAVGTLIDYEEAFSVALEAVADAFADYMPTRGARRNWLIFRGRYRTIEILHDTGHVFRPGRTTPERQAFQRSLRREADLLPTQDDDAPPLFSQLPAAAFRAHRTGRLAATLRQTPLARPDQLLLVLRYECQWPWHRIGRMFDLTESGAINREERILARLRDWFRGRRATTLAEARFVLPNGDAP